MNYVEHFLKDLRFRISFRDIDKQILVDLNVDVGNKSDKSKWRALAEEIGSPDRQTGRWAKRLLGCLDSRGLKQWATDLDRHHTSPPDAAMDSIWAYYLNIDKSPGTVHVPQHQTASNEIARLQADKDRLEGTLNEERRASAADRRRIANSLELMYLPSPPDCDALCMRVKELNSAKTVAIGERDTLRNELAASRASAQSQVAQVRSLEMQRDELKRQRDEVSSQNGALKSQYDSIKAEYDASKNKCDELRSHRDELKTQCDELRLQRDELQIQCNEFHKRFNGAQAEIETLSGLVTELNTTANDLRAELRSHERLKKDLSAAARQFDFSGEDSFVALQYLVYIANQGLERSQSWNIFQTALNATIGTAAIDDPITALKDLSERAASVANLQRQLEVAQQQAKTAAAGQSAADRRARELSDKLRAAADELTAVKEAVKTVEAQANMRVAALEMEPDKSRTKPLQLDAPTREGRLIKELGRVILRVAKNWQTTLGLHAQEAERIAGLGATDGSGNKWLVLLQPLEHPSTHGLDVEDGAFRSLAHFCSKRMDILDNETWVKLENARRLMGDSDFGNVVGSALASRPTIKWSTVQEFRKTPPGPFAKPSPHRPTRIELAAMRAWLAHHEAGSGR